MKPDDKVCLCYGVSLRKLVNFIQRERPAAASQIGQCLSAGTGCGWCVPFLRELHRDVLAGRYDGFDALDSAQYEMLRLGWIERARRVRDERTLVDETVPPVVPPTTPPTPVDTDTSEAT